MIVIAVPVCAKSGDYTAFQVQVTGKGQPILLLPGATCSAHEWDETVRHLQGKYQLHAFTLAGYAGAPALPAHPYLDSMKNQLERYIVDQHLKNVILIGHSIGGFLALWIASEMKEPIQKLVIVDALPFFAGARNPLAKAGFDSAMAIGMLNRYNSMKEEQMVSGQLAVVKQLCNDSTHWNLIASWGAQSDKKTMAYTMAEMLGNDLRPVLKSIHVPTLILAAYDSLPQYPSYTREYVTHIYAGQYASCGTCSVQVATGGTRHFIMYDNPNWYFSELDKWLMP
jgi:pimeloyl-ACP methyl ester carboxylesterase